MKKKKGEERKRKRERPKSEGDAKEHLIAECLTPQGSDSIAPLYPCPPPLRTFARAIELHKNEKIYFKSCLSRIVTVVSNSEFLGDMLEYVAKHGKGGVLPNNKEKRFDPGSE